MKLIKFAIFSLALCAASQAVAQSANTETTQADGQKQETSNATTQENQ